MMKSPNVQQRDKVLNIVKKKLEKRVTHSKAFLIGILEDNRRENIPEGNSRIMNHMNLQFPEILQVKQNNHFFSCKSMS